jgi:hypothetical protein
MSNIVTNLYLSDDTLKLYTKNNHICDNDDLQIIFNLLSNRRYIYNDKIEHSLRRLNFSEISVGDVIKVTYITYSQLKMDYDEYQPFIGKVFFIDEKNHNILFYYDKYDEHKRSFIKTITSSIRPGCSYFGNEDGFVTIFEKLC